MPPHSRNSPPWPLDVGCPVWACDGWGGEVYPERTPRHHWLNWYSRTFNTVEGNSTFYALPSVDTFQTWAEQASDGFHFCFKFPRLISHDHALVACEEVTGDFIDRLEVLAKAGCLGPSFLQLGPKFGPDQFDALRAYLVKLPREFPWAVEVRHRDWFDGELADGQHEARLDDLLSDMKIDRVLFDSRSLFQAEPSDRIEKESQARKPRSPFRQTATASRPLVRFVGRHEMHLNDSYLESWVAKFSEWIEQGLRPIFFAHSPDDRFAPTLVRRWMAILSKAIPQALLEVPKPTPPTRQLNLFGDATE